MDSIWDLFKKEFKICINNFPIRDSEYGNLAFKCDYNLYASLLNEPLQKHLNLSVTFYPKAKIDPRSTPISKHCQKY